MLGFRVGPDGRLSLLTPQPLTLAAPADNVTMDPKGRFLFVSGEGDRLFTFRIQHDGALVPLPDNRDVPTFRIDTQGDGGGELTGTDNGENVTFDPSGRFLYLYTFQNGFDSRSYGLRPFRLDDRGALHPLGQAFLGSGDIIACFCTTLGDLFVARSSGYNEGTDHYRIGPHGYLVPASPAHVTQTVRAFLDGRL